jgi:hypothetical protein
MNIEGPTPLLLATLAQKKDFLYVRIDELPDTYVLPQ